MNIVLAILVLAVLIVVHEFGHFIAAKLMGVYVEKFSIGIGKRVFGKKIGETDYCVSLLPLGGFVKMYGENPNDEKDLSKEGRSFYDKKPWQRLVIVFAGPFANLLFASLVFWGIFMTGYPAYEAKLGKIAAGGAAELSGLQFGDTIVKVGEEKIGSWNELIEITSVSADKELEVTLSDGRALKLTPKKVNSKNLFGEEEPAGDIGADLFVPAIIGSLQKDYPAEKAGILPNDKIISLDGQKVDVWSDSAAYIRSHPGEEVEIVVERDGAEKTFSVTPRENIVKNSDGTETKFGLIGISPIEGNVRIHYGFFDAMALGFKKSYESTKLILMGFVKLIERKVPADSLGGPIMIVQVASDSAESGILTLLTFMAIISVNLAIFNLLPIPILDGGMMVMIIIEMVLRRKVSEKTVGRFQMVGLAILLSLTVFAFYNDLSRIFLK